MMVKLLLAAAVIASTVFLITQFLTVFYFNTTPDGSLSRPHASSHKLLLENVRRFVDQCEKIELPCLLVEEEILKDFLNIEKEHRHSGVHHHRQCRLFCGRERVPVFLIRAKDLNKDKYKTFKERLLKDFDVVEDESGDQREITLERRRSTQKILKHVYLARDNTLIHIVVSYPRFQHEWTSQCNSDLSVALDKRDLSLALAASTFCKHEKLLEPMETTRALIDGVLLHIPKHLAVFLKAIGSRNFIACHYEHARKFVSTYGVDSSPDSEMFRIKARNLLSLVIEIMTELDIPFWLSSGTCLGWFRQCDFIPHSKDVDIGIMIKDYKKGVIAEFKARGFTLKHVFGKIEDSFELSFKMDDLKLDIFFFYEDETNMWNGGTQARTGKKFKYLFDKFSLCWTYLDELVVRVPCQTEAYIRANYGDKWYVSVKTWDWKSSPPNVRENGEWSMKDRPRVIQVFN